MLQKIEKYFSDCLTLYSEYPHAEQSIDYRVGNRVFRINFVTGYLADYFGKAINHLRIPSSEPLDLEIYVMEGKAMKTNLPKPVWNWALINNKGDIDIGKPRFQINYEYWDRIFSMYDILSKKAILWIDDLQEIPFWHRSFPFRMMIDWYYYPYEFQPIHAAAVGTANGCVIIVGKGGTGKSTTALSCLDSELKYIGDDFVLANIENGHCEIHSLYNVAKLEKKDIDRFPLIKNNFICEEVPEDHKLQLFLKEIYPEKLILRARLRAILVPNITGSKITTISPASKGIAMQALIPSTINLLRGDGVRSFKKMSDLIRKTPCFSINLGNDSRLIADPILELLNQSHS